MKSKKTVMMVVVLTAICMLTGCTSSDKGTGDTAGNTVTGNTGDTGVLTEGDGIANNDGSVNNGTGMGDGLLSGYTYGDGTYRGSYVDNNENQISVEFVIKDGNFESVNYRALSYKGQNYLDDTATGAVKEIREQYQQAAEYLIGKNISSVSDLYSPGEVVKDMDTVTGATLRSNKLISAIWDGLNRHQYKMPE